MIKAAFILCLGVLLFGCKKYDDGGKLYRAKKCIIGKWQFNVYRNNSNIKDNIPYIPWYFGKNGNYSKWQNYMLEEFKEDGTFIRTLLTYYEDIEVNDTFQYIGKWSFDRGVLSVNIAGEEMWPRYNFVLDNHQIGALLYYNIKRLDKEEFWYTFQTDDKIEHQFSMKKLN